LIIKAHCALRAIRPLARVINRVLSDRKFGFFDALSSPSAGHRRGESEGHELSRGKGAVRAEPREDRAEEKAGPRILRSFTRFVFVRRDSVLSSGARARARSLAREARRLHRRRFPLSPPVPAESGKTGVAYLSPACSFHFLSDPPRSFVRKRAFIWRDKFLAAINATSLFELLRASSSRRGVFGRLRDAPEYLDTFVIFDQPLAPEILRCPVSPGRLPRCRAGGTLNSALGARYPSPSPSFPRTHRRPPADPLRQRAVNGTLNASTARDVAPRTCRALVTCRRDLSA